MTIPAVRPASNKLCSNIIYKLTLGRGAHHSRLGVGGFNSLKRRLATCKTRQRKKDNWNSSPSLKSTFQRVSGFSRRQYDVSHTTNIAQCGQRREFHASTGRTDNGGSDHNLSDAKRDHGSNVFVLRALLSSHHQAVLDRERSLLLGLLHLINSLDGRESNNGLATEGSDKKILEKALSNLEELFLVVVVGEFNSGKSAFINRLLGDTYCPEGVLPMTDKICVMRYGEEYKMSDDPLSPTMRTVEVPVSWLKHTNLVDTPGTNATSLVHEQTTRNFIPRADLTIFVTSSDRPFSESERQFLQRIVKWKKQILMAVNKVDMLDTADDRDRVMQYVQAQAAEVLGETPIIFGITSKAQREKQLRHSDPGVATGSTATGPHDWNPRSRSQSSLDSKKVFHGFTELERYILETLTSEKKIQLKLSSALGVAEKVLDAIFGEINDRELLLQKDLETMATIEEDMRNFEKTLVRDADVQLQGLDNVLLRLREASDKFIRENLILSNAPNLINAKELERLYEEQVSKGVSSQIETWVAEYIDWIAEKRNRQLNKIQNYLRRRTTGSDSFVSLASLSMRAARISGSGPKGFQERFSAKTSVAELESDRSIDIESYRLKRDLVERGPSRKFNMANSHNSADMYFEGDFEFDSDLAGKVAQAASSFEGRRQKLALQVQRETRAAIADLNPDKQAHDLANSVRSALLQTAIVQAGAVGFGAMLGAAAMDWSGVAGASAIALSGLYLLPHRRRQMQRLLSTKVDRLRDTVHRAAQKNVEQQLRGVVDAVDDALRPFSSFVRDQRKALGEQRRDAERCMSTLEQLKKDVNAIAT